MRDYALALGCTKVHAMSGIMDPAHSLSAHRQTLIDNIRFAADFLAEDGIKVLLEPLNDRDVARLLPWPTSSTPWPWCRR